MEGWGGVVGRGKVGGLEDRRGSRVGERCRGVFPSIRSVYLSHCWEGNQK